LTKFAGIVAVLGSRRYFYALHKGLTGNIEDMTTLMSQACSVVNKLIEACLKLAIGKPKITNEPEIDLLPHLGWCIYSSTWQIALQDA
jgi:hypothetical protein